MSRAPSVPAAATPRLRPALALMPVWGGTWFHHDSSVVAEVEGQAQVMRQAQDTEAGSDFSVPLLGLVTSLISFIPSTQTNVFNF